MELGKEGQQKMGTISAKEPALLPLTFFPMQINYFLSIQLNPYSAVTIQEPEGSFKQSKPEGEAERCYAKGQFFKRCDGGTLKCYYLALV